ncbi:unnamed protein product, partial [Rotaria magnacalcarata]
AARTHCSLRHLKTVQLHDESIDDENLDTPNSNSSIASHNSSQWLRPKYDNMRTNHELSLTLDPDLNHPLSECHIRWARNL